MLGIKREGIKKIMTVNGYLPKNNNNYNNLQKKNMLHVCAKFHCSDKNTLKGHN